MKIKRIKVAKWGKKIKKTKKYLSHKSVALNKFISKKF